MARSRPMGRVGLALTAVLAVGIGAQVARAQSLAPATREITVPEFADANSIWGATGRDRYGRIWVGVSAKMPGASAHLMTFEPATQSWRDRGAVVDRLAQAGLLRPGEGQVKIHTKIVPAADGGLYFASMDEDGEAVDGSALPKWGSHLWRVDPDTGEWRHLLAVPEGLVAAGGAGRFVYALGYWGHVLYQYDTATGRSRRLEVGAVGGHASRNVIGAADGHAFVPRLRRREDGTLAAALVEYDSTLTELAATPLAFYAVSDSPEADHGIVGLAALPDGRMVFVTHAGQLYLIEPRTGQPASVSAIGAFHPAGDAYAPSLFALEGGRNVAGVARRGGRYDWVVFDLAARTSRAWPLDTKGLDQVLLYGSITRDAAGRCYLGGWAARPQGGHRPLLLQVHCGSGARPPD